MRTRMNVEIIGDGNEVVESETVEEAAPAEEG